MTPEERKAILTWMKENWVDLRDDRPTVRVFVFALWGMLAAISLVGTPLALWDGHGHDTSAWLMIDAILLAFYPVATVAWLSLLGINNLLLRSRGKHREIAQAKRAQKIAELEQELEV